MIFATHNCTRIALPNAVQLLLDLWTIIFINLIIDSLSKKKKEDKSLHYKAN